VRREGKDKDKDRERVTERKKWEHTNAQRQNQNTSNQRRLAIDHEVLSSRSQRLPWQDRAFSWVCSQPVGRLRLRMIRRRLVLLHEAQRQRRLRCPPEWRIWHF